jgi:hypothetical protein
VRSKVQETHLYADKPGCLAFSLGDEDRKYVNVDIYEVHDAKCGGDPGVSHRRDTFKVNRASREVLYYDVVHDQYIPFHSALKAQ